MWQWSTVTCFAIGNILYTHECSEEKMIAEVVHLQLKYLKTKKNIPNLVFRSVNNVQNENTTRGVDYFLIVRMDSWTRRFCGACFIYFWRAPIVSSIANAITRISHLMVANNGFFFTGFYIWNLITKTVYLWDLIILMSSVLVEAFSFNIFRF